MEAKTLQVRRTVRMPWMTIAVVALLAAVLAIGIGIATSRSDTTTVPVRTVQIGPKDLSGPTAYPGFVPSGALARFEHQQSAGADVGDTQAAPVTAPNGKPLT